MKQKKRPVTRWKKELDKWFSRYIRAGSASKTGMSKCFTCDKILHWKNLQCGHFVERGHLATRWDETNCTPQCYGCNIALKGNYLSYYPRMVAKYGQDHVDYLLSHRNKAFQGRIDYETLISTYKAKVNKLLSLIED